MHFHAYMVSYQISNFLKLGLNKFTLVTTLIYAKNKAQKRALPRTPFNAYQLLRNAWSQMNQKVILLWVAKWLPTSTIP